jgi:hypothetical protein
MADLEGFWSYVHEDNEAEGYRISRLAKDLEDQYKMLTGEPITLFLDKNAIEWGDDWNYKINSSLARGSFFIPIITPRYFLSYECRREMRKYVNKASNLGVSELILSIHYVNVPALNEETPDDDLISLIKKYHWVDWRELRFAEPETERYRRAVHKLAERLQSASRIVEQVDIPARIAAYEAEATIVATGVCSNNIDGVDGVNNKEDKLPGYLAQLSCFEETIKDKLPETIELITNDINLIGNIFREGTSDLQKGIERGKAFAAGLVADRKIATQLEEPVERIGSQSNMFATQLHEIDSGFRIFIERAAIEIKEAPEYKKDYCVFLDWVRITSEAIKTSSHLLLEMVETMTNTAKISKDLRPVIRRLRYGLIKMVEACEVSEEWVNLIEESNIKCD